MTNGIRVLDASGEIIGCACESCRDIVAEANIAEGYDIEELSPGEETGECFRCGEQLS